MNTFPPKIAISYHLYFLSLGCPGPVRSLRAIEIGYTRVKLSWQPPVDDGGFPVTGYRVYNVRGRPMSGETIDTEYLFDGLKEGTQHYFVVALNRFGEGNPQQLTISTKRSTSKSHSPTPFYYCFVFLILMDIYTMAYSFYSIHF